MKVLKIIGIVLVVLVAIVVILGLVAPKDYQVDRSLTIDAQKELVFRHVQYWRNWAGWSPWAERDSTLQVAVEGADGSEGAMYKWTGDKELTRISHQIPQLPYFCPRNHFAIKKLDFLSCCDSIKRN